MGIIVNPAPATAVATIALGIWKEGGRRRAPPSPTVPAASTAAV